MKRKNKYIYRSKLSEAKFREFVKFFSLDLKAKKIAELTHLNRNTVNRYSFLLRERIVFFCDHECPLRIANHNADSTCPSNQISKNIDNIPHLTVGIVNRNNKVFSEIVNDCTSNQIRKLFKSANAAECIELPITLRRFHALIDPGFKQVYLINANRKCLECACIKGSVIESFKLFARKRLLRFKGLSRSTFALHLKECEFRYNYKDEDTYQMLLKMCREKPLN